MFTVHTVRGFVHILARPPPETKLKVEPCRAK